MDWLVLIISRNSRGADLYFMDRMGNEQSVQVKGIQDGRKRGANGFNSKGAEDAGMAAERLHGETDASLPFRFAKFDLQLPEVGIEEGGALSIEGERPTLRVVR
jgi:hypothetical protein